MAAPFLPSSSPASLGFSLQHVLALPFTPNRFGTLLAQFNLQKFVSSIRENDGDLQPPSEPSRLQTIRRHLRDKSLYALGFSSEILLTPHGTLLFSFDTYGDHLRVPRRKAVLCHEFPHHDLTMAAVWPALFVDKSGNCWDVPFSMAIDLASVDSDSGANYHWCMQHNVGTPMQFGGDQTIGIPPTLLPGTSVKSAFSIKRRLYLEKQSSKVEDGAAI